MKKQYISVIALTLGLAAPAFASEEPNTFWKAMSAIKNVVTPDRNRFDADVWERNRYLDDRGIAVTNRNLTDLSFSAGKSSEVQIDRDGVKFLRRF